MAHRIALAALFACAAVVALGGCEALVTGDGSGDHRAAASRALPDVSSTQPNCSAANFGNFPRVKEIYDEFFNANAPVDFGWTTDPELTADFARRVEFRAVNVTTDDGHELFSFNNCTYERSSARNAEIFASLNGVDETAAYRRFNPRDWIPAAATYYARSATSDVIATQFAYRVACYPQQMQDALARCPDCDDVFVPLSKHDLYKIFEVRFVRAEGGALQVSRIFKFIGIDASGDIVGHAAWAPNRFVELGGETLRAKWRGELAGRLYQALGIPHGTAGMFIRSSATSEYGCGSTSPGPTAPPTTTQPPPTTTQPPPTTTPPPTKAPCAEQRGVCAGAESLLAGGACAAADYREHAAKGGTVYESEESLCDGKDNDCDGEVDEACECDDGQTQPCGPPAKGACRPGTQTCVFGRWGACTGGVQANYEVCDGEDNDCDGEVDEAVVRSCENACGGGVQTCTAGTWSACSTPAPAAEICDGLDNDCDGLVDGPNAYCDNGGICMNGWCRPAPEVGCSVAAGSGGAASLPGALLVLLALCIVDRARRRR